jgi:hypothetical protein
VTATAVCLVIEPHGLGCRAIAMSRLLVIDNSRANHFPYSIRP